MRYTMPRVPAPVVIEPDLAHVDRREELEIRGALAYARAIWRGAGNPTANRRDHAQLMLIAKLWLMLERDGVAPQLDAYEHHEAEVTEDQVLAVPVAAR